MITLETIAKLHATFPLEQAILLESAVMKMAFDAVANKADWRAPIDATVDPTVIGCTAEVIALAVDFFTATKATVGVASLGGLIRIQAIGYRAGPAA